MAINLKSKSRKKAIWLSYDLGLRGDYSSLYAWLDQHGARECGDTTAFFEVEFEGGVVEWLRQELPLHMNLAPKDRIYAIFLDRATSKVKGKFVFGGRHKAIWEGYGQIQNAEDTEDS